ncbi:Alpha-(1,3)-fucosyltransferase 4 [Holothuria leucospilota]|uniref:Fucosyltransferase n=1 Tax=Holothuria leucospilota TaxID=206669 RepID=A0A9Q1BFA8_HOLLE|nr:Alpha-(1,3)-fucosyltransferase 4 [Holothuria leucospilota]
MWAATPFAKLTVSYMGRIARLLILFLLLVIVVTFHFFVPIVNSNFRESSAPSGSTIAHSVSRTPKKNVSFVRDKTPRTQKSSAKYSQYLGERNDVWGRTLPADVQMAPRKTIVNVGFFEGYRKTWNYPTLFQPPLSPRICECFKENDVKYYANVTLETNTSRTGMYGILFFPQDVSVKQLEPHVWDAILMTSPHYQRRIYATFEGAAKLKFLALDPPYDKKVFHWSLTHHSKSEFTMPYGYYSPFSKQLSTLGPKKNWAGGRTGLVAWMSTWSVTTWKRDGFVNKLQKHISVDMFGERNGRKRCPRNSTECEQKIRKYKFYLALENSCCSEYISEKFWRTLLWDIVPIVVGAPRESYERLAPPHSFIYADDFVSIQDLAQYIFKLHKNDTLYNQYFEWKEKGEVFINYPDLHNTAVTSREPPKTFFYSCNSVCKVSRKYLDEKPDTVRNNGEKLNNSSFFDPKVSWWCGSCTKCGKHDWIRN